MSLLFPNWTWNSSESFRPDQRCPRSIARYTQECWGSRQRTSYLKEIDRVFKSLAKNPVIGRTCGEIREGYRKFPHGAHVIYYKQLVTEELLIVRILHTTMDDDSHMGA